MAARYEGVQALRAAAALLVLLAHAGFVTPAGWEWLRPWCDGGGAVGVDIFFVLSGFVIALSADRPETTAKRFLLDRATRVLPLYVVMSVPFLGSGPFDWRELWNTFAFLPVFDHGAYTAPAHDFGWSVAMELWLYLAFAAALRWAPAGRQTAFFAAAAALLVLASCLHRGTWLLPRFVGSPVVLEFLAGVALYRCRSWLGPRASALAPAGVVGVAMAAGDLPFLGYYNFTLAVPELALLRVAFWGVPAAMLTAGVVALDRLGARWPAPLVGLGDRSYSLYLVQPFAIHACASVPWPHWLLGWGALLALGLLLAHASHRWIERPATERLRAIFRPAERGGASALRPA